jgi:hypothetical protein
MYHVPRRSGARVYRCRTLGIWFVSAYVKGRRQQGCAWSGGTRTGASEVLCFGLKFMPCAWSWSQPHTPGAGHAILNPHNCVRACLHAVACVMCAASMCLAFMAPANAGSVPGRTADARPHVVHLWVSKEAWCRALMLEHPIHACYRPPLTALHHLTRRLKHLLMACYVRRAGAWLQGCFASNAAISSLVAYEVHGWLDGLL